VVQDQGRSRKSCHLIQPLVVQLSEGPRVGLGLQEDERKALIAVLQTL